MYTTRKGNCIPVYLMNIDSNVHNKILTPESKSVHFKIHINLPTLQIIACLKIILIFPSKVYIVCLKQCYEGEENNKDDKIKIKYFLTCG